MNQPQPAVHATENLPRWLIIGASLLVLFTIAVVGAVRIFAADSKTAKPVTAEQSRDFRFEDRDDGSVAVLDGGTQREITRLAPGTNGFVRATLRGLARERRQHNQGSATSFRLTTWTNGQITLDDLATGRRVELAAFGPVNANDFTRLLQLPPTQVTLKE